MRRGGKERDGYGDWAAATRGGAGRMYLCVYDKYGDAVDLIDHLLLLLVVQAHEAERDRPGDDQPEQRKRRHVAQVGARRDIIPIERAARNRTVNRAVSRAQEPVLGMREMRKKGRSIVSGCRFFRAANTHAPAHTHRRGMPAEDGAAAVPQDPAEGSPNRAKRGGVGLHVGDIHADLRFARRDRSALDPVERVGLRQRVRMLLAQPVHRRVRDGRLGHDARRLLSTMQPRLRGVNSWGENKNRGSPGQRQGEKGTGKGGQGNPHLNTPPHVR